MGGPGRLITGLFCMRATHMGFPGAAGGSESDNSTGDGAMQDVNVPADGVNADAATNTSNKDSAAEQSENAQTDNASAPADKAMPATPQGGDMPNQPPHDLLVHIVESTE